MTNWTQDDRTEFAAFWKSPIGLRALAHLKEHIAVKGKPSEVSPGYDLLVLSALENSHAKGQASVLEEIKEMQKPIPERKPLPNEFERTPKPTPAK